MTFSLRRKLRTIHRGPARWGRRIISALFVAGVFATTANAQGPPLELPPPTSITPKFVPTSKPSTTETPISTPPLMLVPPAIEPKQPEIVPAPKDKNVPMPKERPDPGEDLLIRFRPELPGPQTVFARDSEAQFFERLSQDYCRQGTGKAIFPQQQPMAYEPIRPRNFEARVRAVEPGYVCHRRLYFEQPNFERAGYDFGILQPFIGLGVFYYDLGMLPYHAWSDLQNRTECSTGKCMPGDPAPLLYTPERFSVTGLLGQSAAIVGLGYLFPR